MATVQCGACILVVEAGDLPFPSTVADLMELVSQSFVGVGVQRLYTTLGVMLDDPSRTLASLGIVPTTTLMLIDQADQAPAAASSAPAASASLVRAPAVGSAPARALRGAAS